MRMRLWTFVAACFYYSGLVKLVRWWKQRMGPSLVILNYHCATGGDLRSHLLYLRRHYHVLHLEAALEELYTPCKDGTRRKDQRTPLVLTFDDGYYDNYTHALPLARELQVPITVFLIPGYIASGSYFWWLEGKRLVGHAQVGETTIEGHTYHLDRVKDRTALTQVINARVRYATSVAEREAFLAATSQALAISSSVTAEERLALPLKWAEVQEMEESGWISFGAHTMHHPVLAYLSDLAEVQREVTECRTVLEQQLKHPVRTFAYPIGRLKHIGDNGLQAAQKAGYSWAVTTEYGFNTSQSDPHLLRRVEVDVNQHWLLLAAEACGIWHFFSRLRRMPTQLIKSAMQSIRTLS